MKKILITSLTILSLQFVYARGCVDLPKNLNRWEESPSILLLQNFLAEKGLLKATPNGYFGNGTFSAVKAYQKSNNIFQTGTVGVLTRASIKKETCNIKYAPIVNQVITPPVSQSSVVTTTPPPTPIPTPISTTTNVITKTNSVIYKTPSLSRFSTATFFAGGSRDWDVYLYGADFSTSSPNSVYFKSKNSPKKYFIGDVKSLNGTDLILPRDFTAKTLPCGTGCNEMILIGAYDVSVVSNYLESNTIYTTVNGFTSSVVTGTANQAVPSKVTGAFLGRLSFAVGLPVQLISITPAMLTEGFPAGDIKATRIKDDATGATFISSLNTIPEFQSQVMSLYGDINGFSSGRIMTTFKITIMDYISRKNTTFSSPTMLTTVTAY